MATEKQKVDAANYRAQLVEQVSKRGWTRTKNEIFTHAIIPVSAIVATGILTISYFTYRLLTQNNTIAFTRHGVRSFFWFTPSGHLIQSEEAKKLVKETKMKEKDYMMTNAYNEILIEQKHRS